ncbi:MAG: cation-translocating P-type ATPase [Candidatus Marithrix sp.]
MSNKPLLKCEILHRLPGRLRIGCEGLFYLDEEQEQLLRQLQNIASIESAKVNILTKNILIYHDQTVTESILEIVESVITSFSLTVYKKARAAQNKSLVAERDLHDEPLSTTVKRIAITSAILIYAFWKAKIPATTLAGRFLTIPALSVIALSLPMFKSGFNSLRISHRPNADALSSTAIIASIITGRDISALTIILLHDTAELITGYTMNRTRNAIRQMVSLGEEYAWRLNETGGVDKVQVSSLRVDDSVVVHTGDKISVDGMVIAGEAVIDQAPITGEFLPIIKKADDHVFAGTIVVNGTITIKTEKVGDQTAVARIVHLVEEAPDKKAAIQAYADRFSAQLIPLNFLLAGIVFIATKSPVRALNMLIIDFSCGMRLSTAAALSSAINTAARNGVLIKGGNYLETLAEADTLILDKTGTITKGKPTVVSIIPADKSISSNDIIKLAAAAEKTSTHPMATAILNKVNSLGCEIPQASDTKVIVARGIEANVVDSIVRVGNKRFMLENNIELATIHEKATALSVAGEQIVYVASDKNILGVIGIHDPVRDNMKKSLNRLRQSGIDDVILLTGDLEHQAEIIANRMALDRFESELLPEDKVRFVLQLQAEGSNVVMVGDGINDAPALAYANVGVALGGTRTDLAMEAADITIIGDDPMLLPATVNLSKKTMKIIRQNFATTIGVNITGLVLASIGVLPVFWGAIIHNSSTILVVANSLRLLSHDINKKANY